MMHCISLSGGLGSAVTALAAHEAGLPFRMIFADTLIEDEDLYRFLDEIEAHTGVEITRVVDGRTPWDVFKDKRYIGNTRTAHCSAELKTKPIREWLDANTPQTDPLVLGMDWSEMDRIERAAKNWAPRPVISLLNELQVLRTQWPGFLKRAGIKQPRLYDLGFAHNNCGGFCVKAGKKQFANLRRHFPDRYQQHADLMDEAMNAIGPTARPFLRDNTGGETTYQTLNEFAADLDQGAKLPLFDHEGCGCFTEEAN